MDRRRLLAVAVLDLAVLAELAAAMYFAARTPDEFAISFLKVFFALLLPTLLLGRLALRRLDPH